jgi:hypothetical protein
MTYGVYLCCVDEVVYVHLWVFTPFLVLFACILIFS